MTSGFVGRLSVSAFALFLLLGQYAATARTTAPAANWGAGWQVVLAAGDDAEPVFDDATRALAQRLVAAGVPAGNIHRLSSAPGELHGRVELATEGLLLRRIAGLPARPGDRCFIFLTSHGERGAGLWLARSNRTLSPDDLDRALSQGCAAVPTVVIVSGCYTGGFAVGNMAKPNRIVLTAARRDRPSFGCQVQRTYTFFDECLLAALPHSATWRTVFDQASRCVRHMEQALDERPSEPQAHFGGAVAALKVGF